MNKKLKYLLHLLGPVIFIYILFQIDFGLLKKELLNVNIYFLFLAVFFMIVQIILRSLRWQVVLKGVGIKLKLITSVSLYWLGMFVGVITPGRIGELAKVYFLKNRGENIFRSFFSVLFDRIVDVITLLLMGFLIFLFFLKDIGIYVLIIGLSLILFLIFIFLLIDKRSFLHKIFVRMIGKILPADSEEYSQFTFSKFWQSVKDIKKKQIFPFLFYLITAWLFYFTTRYMTSLALGLEFSFLEISVISALVAIVLILPISVAGLGTRDVSMIYLFSLFGLTVEIALLFSLLVFTMDLLVVSLGLIPYFKESSLVNKVKQID